jgi:MFS family permease
VFLIAFIVGLFAIGSVAWVKDVTQTIHAHGFSPLKSFSSSFQAYVASVFILSLGTLPVAILLFKTQSLGFAIATIPLFYMVYNTSFALFSWPAGKASDTWGSGKVIVLGYVFLILAYSVLHISVTSYVLVAGFLALGIFSAFTDGVQRSHLSRLISPENRGIAYGYLNASAGFGALFAGVGGGYIWQYYGDEIALTSAMVVVGVGLVVFLWSLTLANHIEKLNGI